MTEIQLTEEQFNKAREEAIAADIAYQKYYDEHFDIFYPIAIAAIKREYSPGHVGEYKFTTDELEAISLCADGADNFTRAKKDWQIIEPKEEGLLSFKCQADSYLKIASAYDMAIDIYNKCVDLDLRYVSDFEYMNFIAEVIRIKSKFTFYFEED